ARGYGVYQGIVRGDEGDDRITIQGFSRRFLAFQSAASYGLYEGLVEGGNGDDEIVITASSQIRNSNFERGGYGVLRGHVDGGRGDDLIRLSGTTLNFVDSLITGGPGDDVFETGRGSGLIDGGRGTDTLNLSFFDPATMTIADLGGGSLEIASRPDIFQAIGWSQTIVNIEQFELGGTLFTANELLATVGP
ncbi:MAG TPA: hypothetical protein V6D06_19345, partial [Trichocoleus sp.]